MKPSPPNISARQRQFRWLVPLLSVFFVLLVWEVGFRIYRYEKLLKADEGNYLVIPQPLYAFDAKSGYRYHSQKNLRIAWMAEDHQFIRTNSVVTNNFGHRSAFSVEPTKPKNEFRIAVIGDSLTACIHNDKPWPDLLQKELNADQELKAKWNVNSIKVMNFARDGVAIEQFPAILENEARSFSPDLVLPNFITADIYRKQIWRETITIPHSTLGYQAVLSCISPPAALSNPDCAFAGIIVKNDGKVSAPELKAIKTELAQVFARRLNWFSPIPQFINLALGRPTFEMPNMSIEGRENGLKRSAAALRLIKQNFPSSLLLHLPTYWEIIHQAVPKLTGELMAMAPEVGIIPMIAYLPEIRDRSEVNPWINYPTDMHFSNQGAAVYAKAVHKLLRERTLGKQKLASLQR